MSRNFVHENAFFALFSIFGSVYYHAGYRHSMQNSVIGRIVELIFVFFPYVLIRPFFPTTSFSNAGTSRLGRSEKNRRFYEIATLAVKIFYLWAKYFIGFFINFMVFLDLLNEEWLLHGMFLLNVGTVSLAVFLHTLRFRKVLPPRLTFSLYLLQIYATFSAIPTAYRLFVSHPKLCALCCAGLLANLTRRRVLHAVWSVLALYLLTQTEIEW
jgi:hypothetical protein